jgi:energy-converting hydrogenase Eha subunit B
MENNLSAMFRKALISTSVLVGLIALLGMGIGYLAVGSIAIASALIGSAIALVFSSVTILSIWFGSKLGLNGFFALLLGGWLVKIVVFALALSALSSAEFISGPVLFIAVVASVIGTLAIEMWVVLSSRVPTIGQSKEF